MRGEVVTIGPEVDFNSLSRWQRHRLRKKGVEVPRKPMPRGYKQSAEHVEKRKRTGADSHHWTGDDVAPVVGRKRALKLYKDIGPCIVCGAEKSERHHRDENPSNNAPENIAILCRSCHMKEHARLRKEKGASCAKK